MPKKLLITAVIIVTFTFVSAGTANALEHTVSKGESLWKIASQYHTTVNTLQKANSLSTADIYTGQQLWVPRYHFVKTGESLYLIGKKYGIHYSQIIRHNNLTSTAIYPGQKLYIPDTGNTTSRGDSPSRLSPYEMDFLARLITAEADSESFKTKVAVGAVVLNRVKSSLFPNTVAGVINQVDETGRYQFTPVLNGWINRPASYQSILAAREAVKGTDPSYGALYFWESWVQNEFLNSRPVTTVLDSFTFTR